MSKDLRTFLEQAKQLGPEFYVEVDRKLKPELEVQVIQEKLAREGCYPVIYCAQIEGSNLPLVTNLFGSYDMLALIMGLNPKEIGKNKNAAFLEYWRRGKERRPVKMVPPSSAPIKDVVLKGEDVDLGILPITRQAVLNSAKYIPIGQLICRKPGAGTYNSGIYRHEVKGKNKLGCFSQPSGHTAYAWREYAKMGKPMEAVILIGHHPAVGLGTAWHGGYEVDELEVMGGYLGESLEITPAETVDLPVPAYGEIAIEGFLDTSRMTTDGPYSEWTGYYGAEHECYEFTATAITMRKDAIYHDLDPCHREHNILAGIGVQSSTYDAVRAVVPSVRAIHMPPSGGGMITAYISIDKRIPGEGKRAGWAAVNAYRSTHFAIVVDEDIDVYNEEEVLWAVYTRCCPDKDIDVVSRIIGGALIPTTYDETRLKKGYMATKMVIDATQPVGQPLATRIRPPKELWDTMKLEDYVKGYRH